MTGTVIGRNSVFRGNGRRATFGIFRVFTLRHGLLDRERIWIDSAGLVARLTTPWVRRAPRHDGAREEPGQVRIARPNSRR
jgi:hypothetical protein